MSSDPLRYSTPFLYINRVMQYTVSVHKSVIWRTYRHALFWVIRFTDLLTSVIVQIRTAPFKCINTFICFSDMTIIIPASARWTYKQVSNPLNQSNYSTFFELKLYLFNFAYFQLGIQISKKNLAFSYISLY